MRRFRIFRRRAPRLETESPTAAAIRETIEHWSRRGLSSVARELDTAVALDDGSGQVWTVRIARGHLAMVPGRTANAETTVYADPLTLVAVVKGKRSGLEAFLLGRLRVRGNLSLALKLDGLFDRRSERSRRPRPRRIQAGGVSTFLLDAGEGPPVILLHGLGATNASMLTTLWELSSSYRVLAPDLPGFGDSGKPAVTYNAAFFARWLLGLMDATGIEQAHLVGNSMGGRIALEAALTARARVGRLALLAPAVAFRRYRQLVPIVRSLRPELAALPLPVARHPAHQGLRMLFSRPERVRPSWYEAAVDEHLRVFNSPPGRVAFFSAAREIYLDPPFGSRGFWSRLSRLDHPALFLWGDRDRLVPAGFARHVERALPEATSIILRDCGHVPQFEKPEETHAHVRSFLAAEGDASRLRPSMSAWG